MEIASFISIAGGICGGLSTIIAFIILIIKPIRSKFIAWIGKTADTENINKKIDRLTELVETMAEQVSKLQEETHKQSNALQASLRNSILNLYYKCITRGSITLFEKQNLLQLYENYENLNGNSFIHDCVKQLLSLPLKD